MTVRRARTHSHCFAAPAPIPCVPLPSVQSLQWPGLASIPPG